MKEIERGLKDISDRVYFGSGEYLPIVGTMRMSYGRLIQLLKARRVKRIYLMADGQIAIVEVGLFPAMCHIELCSCLSYKCCCCQLKEWCASSLCHLHLVPA